MHRLEDKSKAPKRVRQREIISIQKQRIIKIRKERIRGGKEKLTVIYQDEYQEKISAWKIQKVIENWKLYYHPKKARKKQAEKKASQKEEKNY